MGQQRKNDENENFNHQLSKFIENLPDLLKKISNESELINIFIEAAKKLDTDDLINEFAGKLLSSDDLCLRKILLARELAFFNNYWKTNNAVSNKCLDMAKIILGSLGKHWVIDIMTESLDLISIINSKKI